MTLGSEIRDHIDSIAPPVGIEEVMIGEVVDVRGSDRANSTASRRWALPVAATAAAVIGAVALFGHPFDSGENVVTASETETVGSLLRTAGSWQRFEAENSAFTPSDSVETTVNDGETLTGTSQIVVRGVTETADGLLAVGHEQIGLSTIAAVWSTADGRSWERVDAGAPAFGDPNPESESIAPVGFSAVDVVVDGSLVVMVGTKSSDTASPVAWRSSNGGDWERSDLPAASATLVTMSGVVSTSSGFTAVGVDNRDPERGNSNQVMVWTSTDGIDWEPTTSSFEPGDLIQRVEAVGDRIVAVGSTNGFRTPSAAAWTSDDGGQTWTPSVLPAPPDDRPVTEILDLAVGPDGLVAVGTQAATGTRSVSYDGAGRRSLGDQQDITVWSSPDGATWQQAAQLREPERLAIEPAIAWGPAGFLVTFTSISAENLEASAWITSDGTQPSAIEPPPDLAIDVIAPIGNAYATLGASIAERFTPPPSGVEPSPAIQIWHLGTN